MKRLLLLLTLLISPLLVQAQTGDGLKGEYFNTIDLTGGVVRTRLDKVIDFDFGSGAPLTGINHDNFSIRWTGQVQAPVTGSYTFTTYSDDGVRLWINGVKILENWTGHAPTYDDSTPVNLVAGQRYDIRLEYFEGIIGAQLQLLWAYPGQTRQLVPQSRLFSGTPIIVPNPVIGNGNGLRGDYYTNIDLVGTPALTRTEAVDFDWASNSPATGIGNDFFSACWTGQLLAPITGEVTLATVSDDGVRLYINNQLVISNWTLHAATTNYSAPIQMTAGQLYDIRLEYFENQGSAVAKLQWQWAGQSLQSIPRQYLYAANTAYTPPALTTLEFTPENIDAARFLIQATYGPSLQDIADVRSKGYEAWLNEQFNLPTESHLDYLYAIRDTGERVNPNQMQESFWTQALVGRDQLRQRMKFALSQIFVVSQLGGMLDNEPYALASYLDTLNKDAFGNFRQLLEDVTLHPAMGRYLDMMASEKEDAVTGRTPNENYAREILQLFSIGLYQLNPDGTLKRDATNNAIPTYDQDEVKGFSQAFTGWHWGGNTTRTDRTWSSPSQQYTWTLPMQAWPTKHSPGEKILLNGVVLPAEQTPEKDLQDALDNVFNHPNVGPFIGKQLIQRLVTSNPSPDYVARVTAAFNNNGQGVRGDLKAVLRAILLDTEARQNSRIGYGSERPRTRRSSNRDAVTNESAAPSSASAKMREPVVRWAHLLRAFNAQSVGARYRIWYVDSPESALGQGPMRAPTVFNFFEPDYALPGPIAQSGIVSPEFKLANETTVIGSSNFMRDTIYGGFTNANGYPVTLDYSRYLLLTAEPAKLVEQLNLMLLAGAMSQPMQATVVNAIKELPARNAGERLRAAIYLLVTSKEFVIQK